MRLRSCLTTAAMTALLVANAPVVAAATEITAADLGRGPARVIVKLRNADAAVAGDEAPADLARLAGRTGVPLQQSRRITTRIRVVELGVVAAPGPVSAAIDRLRADPDVQYAELDRHRTASLVPNDPGYAPGNSNGQWYLRLDPSTPSAADAVDAWSLTTGNSGVVVAVLDTGIRYDHPDLGTAGSGGRLLPGFDFVSNTTVANDGDGWDLDPSDPGDWVAQGDVSSLPFSNCAVSDSSWHGTRTAGIIGARTNNAAGVAGLLWQGWIVPVRVLGKCGGFDSDITAAMLWAAGVPVDGAPANPYPARVVNLSLGGGDTCPQSYLDTITALRARGVVVVASAGNEGSIVEAPANCPGVVAVAALRHVGTKVGFSNLGPEIVVSAPGGNCVNTGTGEPCLYSIDTTTNLGTQGPAANAYTDAFNYNVGTSFSAPIVSGITGLMLSVNSRLSTTNLIARLQEGATKPFPVSSEAGVPVCADPATNGPQAVECTCTTDTCGAGMANALGSVNAALRPVAAVNVPATVAAGQNVVLDGTPSSAACGSNLGTYAWAVVSSIGGASTTISGANGPTATVVAPASGSYVVRLTVTDDAGRIDTADVRVSSTAATTTAAPFTAAPVCAAPVVAVNVSPVRASTRAGGTTLAFVAEVANAGSTSVTWYVDGVAGGSASIGTISASGVYTPPASQPATGKVTVKAVPVADTARFASAVVTVGPPQAAGGGGGGGAGGGGGGVDLALLVLAALAGLARRRRREGRGVVR
ncbi:MAG: S8 family serine peptidase [Steroidobacteraceae bacterium]